MVSDPVAICGPTPRINAALFLAGELTTKAREIGGRNTWIYFIREEGWDGAIKVGVAQNPYHRLSSLQTGNSARLELVGLFWGPASLEKVIHEHFASDRLAGEWFTSVEDLEALAEAFDYFTRTDHRASSRLYNEAWGQKRWAA